MEPKGTGAVMQVTQLPCNRRRQRQAGAIAAMDLLYYVVGLAVLAAFIYMGAQYAKRYIDEFVAMDQIQKVQMAVQAAYEGTLDLGTGSLNAELLAIGAFPSNMVSGTTVLNKFNGTVTVSGNGTLGYTVAFGGLPTASCAALAQKLAGETAGTGISAIRINSSSLSLPVKLATAQAACSVAGQGQTGGNTLAITYQR